MELFWYKTCKTLNITVPGLYISLYTLETKAELAYN